MKTCHNVSKRSPMAAGRIRNIINCHEKWFWKWKCTIFIFWMFKATNYSPLADAKYLLEAHGTCKYDFETVRMCCWRSFCRISLNGFNWYGEFYWIWYFVSITYCVKTKSEITMTIVTDTNIIAKNSVNVWEERQSFEGALQKLIRITF